MLAIGAASIIAKVFRDGLMEELEKKYPDYDFEKNKGYPTKSHMQTLRVIGLAHNIETVLHLLRIGQTEPLDGLVFQSLEGDF